MFKTIEELTTAMTQLQASMQQTVTEAAEGWEDTFASQKAMFQQMNAQASALHEAQALQIPAVPEKQPLKALPQPAAEAGQKPNENPAKTVNLNFGAAHTPLFDAYKALAFKDERAIKDLGITESPKGGWLIPPQISERIIQRLEASLVFTALKAEFMPIDNLMIEVPVENTDMTGYWVAENQTVTTSDFVGGSQNMTLKWAAAAVAVSRQLLNSTRSAAVEELITRRITNRLRRTAELAYLTGTGAVPTGANNSGAQPRGLVNIPNVNSFGVGSTLSITGTTATASGAAANGGLPKLTDFSRAMQMVEVSDVPDAGTRAWLMHPRQLGVLREMGDEVGRPYFVDNVSDSRERPMLYGYPVYTTTQIPTTLTVGTSTDCSYIMFGEWSNFMIGNSPVVDLQASEHVNFLRQQIVYLGMLGTDCMVAYPQAFTVMTGVRMTD